jgi:hypothetical protein
LLDHKNLQGLYLPYVTDFEKSDTLAPKSSIADMDDIGIVLFASFASSAGMLTSLTRTGHSNVVAAHFFGPSLATENVLMLRHRLRDPNTDNFLFDASDRHHMRHSHLFLARIDTTRRHRR